MYTTHPFSYPAVTTALYRIGSSYTFDPVVKTYLTYGFAMALAGAVLTLVLYFLGFHSDPAKVQIGQWISLPVFVIITVICIVLGTKARRTEVPPNEEFGYGRALGAGVMIVLFASLIGIVTNAIYFSFINPDFVDVMVQAQSDKLAAKGVGAAQLEQMEKGMRFMMKPPILAVFGFLQGMFWGTIISLVTSAFLKRSATAEPPPVTA